MENLSQSNVRRLFNLGIIIKGIDGTLELIGAVLLLFFDPEKIRRLIFLFTQQELIQDPKDVVANFLIKLGGEFTANIRNFAIVFLLVAGLIKLVLVFELKSKRRRLWVYPAAITVFGLFALYQVYEYTLNHSPVLIFLSILDLLIIVFICLNYRYLKHEQLYQA